jgi:putative redox protein
MPRKISIDAESVKYGQTISIGSHVLHADESIEDGGHDQGPGARDLVLAALGACASITAQVYAERRQWPLRGVHVEVSYSRILAENTEGAGTRVGMVDRVDMGISFAGDLSTEQQERLFAVANSHGCAVHRMLVTQVEVHPKLLIGQSS